MKDDKKADDIFLSLAESTATDHFGRVEKFTSVMKNTNPNRTATIQRLLNRDRRLNLSKQDRAAPPGVLAAKVKSDLVKAYRKIHETNWELSNDAHKELKKRIEVLAYD